MDMAIPVWSEGGKIVWAQRVRDVILALGLVISLLHFSVTQSQAVPSFARQTGLECSSCHTVFPELTIPAVFLAAA
jgi:hypothetical protein